MNLSEYKNTWYKPGSKLKIITWMLASRVFFETFVPFPSVFKCFLLKIFGAKIGSTILIKPNVKIKYPWYLTIGTNVWIGENVWIDNLCKVTISDNCCISQGAMLLTGNHNFKRSSFDLILGEIILKEHCWVGAKAVVCPSTILHEYSILSVGSVATGELLEKAVYQGNPATFKKYRFKEVGK